MNRQELQVKVLRRASWIRILCLASLTVACAEGSGSGGGGAPATVAPSVTTPTSPNSVGTTGVSVAPPNMTGSGATSEPGAEPTSSQVGTPSGSTTPIGGDTSGMGGNSPDAPASGGDSGGMGGSNAAAGDSGAGGTASEMESGGAVTELDGGAPEGGATGVAPDAAVGSPVDPGYEPCPATGPCKIMPFGDSITEGCCAFNGGYRVELIRLARQAGQDITYVGSASNGPAMVDGMPFPQNHEGHGGYTIDDNPARNTNGISPFVATSIPAYMPDIITLMIGTNDINGNIDVQTAPDRLAALLDSIFEQDPEVLVVLAQMVPTTNDGTNQAVQAYNAAIPDLVSARVAMGRHLILVDMYEAFVRDADYKSSLMADGLHPNTAGYARMAETWYAAIAPYLH